MTDEMADVMVDETSHAMAIEWIDVGALADIAPRGARCVETPRGRVGVFRTADDQVFALDNRCPHRGGPLTEGIVHGHSVTCPLHNWVIALATGEAAGADEGHTPIWPIRLVGDRILLGLAGRQASAARVATEPG